MTKPTISQHLAVLREAGLAAATAVGTSRRYRALPDALRGLHGALVSPSKWVNADADPQDPELVPDVQTKPVVVAAAVVGTSQAATYTAFTDPAVYSRWLGVPVTIQDGRFACTMEWGTSVPGREMTGYLRIRPHPSGAQSRCIRSSTRPRRRSSCRAPGRWSSAACGPGSSAPVTRGSPCRPGPPGPSAGT